MSILCNYRNSTICKENSTTVIACDMVYIGFNNSFVMSLNFIQQQLNIFYSDDVEGFRFSDFMEIFINF